MADGLLAKSGKDSIDIAGHKIPIALIGAIVAVIGVVLFMRARSQGSTASRSSRSWCGSLRGWTCAPRAAWWSVSAR